MSDAAYAPTLSAGASAARYLRSLDPGLPRPVWLLQAGTVANFFGNGLVLPFLVIYLHNVRGFGFGLAGLVVASFGTVSLVSTSLGGPLADRLGARAVAAASLALLALGYGLFPLARTPWQAFLLIGVAGLGNGAVWPSLTSLMVGHAGPTRRGAVFSVNRVAGNLGLGLGAAAGGLLASTHHPGSFDLLFRLDAGTFLVFGALLALLPPLPRPERTVTTRPGSYADVLRDRPYLAIVLLNTLLVAGGFAVLEAGLPAFAKNQLGLSERAIGFLFFLNVAVVVLLQLPVAKLLAGRSRLRALAAMSIAFACAWLLVLAAGLWLQAVAAGLLLAVAVLVFSLAECVHAPAQGGLVADLAVEGLQGRYFALSTNSYALGFMVGPAVGGLLLAAAPLALWPCAALVCVAAAAAALLVERRVPAAVRVAS
jgi:predicted MFS family arabinose efflux permease